MKSVDVYDITEAFRCLDTDCEGFVRVEDVQTLFLGLGYQPVDIAVPDLQRALLCRLQLQQRTPPTTTTTVLSVEDADGTHTTTPSPSTNSNNSTVHADKEACCLWSLQQVLLVLEKFQRYPTNNGTRTAQLKSTFDVLDADAKGFLNAADILRLSQECGGGKDGTDEITLDQAERMLAYVLVTAAAAQHHPPPWKKKNHPHEHSAAAASVSGAGVDTIQMSPADFFRFMSPPFM